MRCRGCGKKKYFSKNQFVFCVGKVVVTKIPKVGNTFIYYLLCGLKRGLVMAGYVLGSSFVGPLADHINPRYIFVVKNKNTKKIFIRERGEKQKSEKNKRGSCSLFVVQHPTVVKRTPKTVVIMKKMKKDCDPGSNPSVVSHA